MSDANRTLLLTLACAIVLGAGIGCKEETKTAAPPPPDVVVTTVVEKEVPIYSEWIGTTTGYINAVIRPQAKGFLLSKDYKEGEVVHSGDLLFQIDPREFQTALDDAQGQLARAEAALGKSKLDVARYTPLAKEGAVSQQELDNAVQQNLANKAQVDSMRAAVEQAKLNLAWTRVTSPIDGLAGIAVGQVGNLVDPTTQLTTVSQVDPIKVAFPVSEQEYLRWARSQAARTDGPEAPQKDALELILADGSVYPRRGTLSVVGSQVDLRTGTLLLEGQFPNPGNLLRPGGYAKVRAQIEKRGGALLVPQRAVMDMQGTAQVVVVGADNVAQIRPVKTGPKIGTDWIIEEGLKPGETIVVEGLQKVASGKPVAPKPMTAAAPAPAPAR